MSDRAHKLSSFRTVQYVSGRVILLDQTRLPFEESYVELSTLEDVARAIETMVVRGAPAIGVTAAFGIALAARSGVSLESADIRLRRTRPTAVNLFHALDQMQRIWLQNRDPDALEAEAYRLYSDDRDSSLRIGEIGAKLIPDGASILTHCNAAKGSPHF